MWQNLLVAPIVAIAFLWVLWNVLLPVPVRNRLLRLAGRPVPEGGACCGCSGCGEECGPKAHPHSEREKAPSQGAG